MQKQKQAHSLKGMFADYRDNHFSVEILGDWGSALFYRPAGLVLAWLLVPTGITPNAVTAIGAALLPVMIAAAAFCQPGTALAIVVSLAIVFLVLDCADGPVARATGKVSNSGYYWDAMADLTYRGCAYMTVGYLADRIHPWPLPVNQMSCLAFAAWLALLARLARKNLKRVTPRKVEENAGPKPAKTFTVYPFLSGMDTLFPPLVAVAYLSGLLPEYIGWIVFYSFADVVVALLEASRRFKAWPG